MVVRQPLNPYPKEWVEVSIESLCKTFTKQTGFDYSAYIKPSLIKSYRKGFIPFIQNKDFEGLWTNFDTDYFIPNDIAINFPNIYLDEKCLLISISGKVGNVGVFSNKKNAFVGGAIAIGKFKDIDLLEWVVYYLFSNEGQQKLLKNVKSGSHKNLILDDIRKIHIPIPPKQEQQAIATALSDTDALIDALEKLIAKKEAIKTGTMQELLTGKKRLDGFSGEWINVNLGRDATLKARIGWQGLTVNEYRDSGEYYLVTGTDFKGGLVNWDTCHYVDKYRYTQDKNIQLRNGDILITKDGTIGKVGYVENLTLPATLNSGVFVVRPKHEEIFPKYLYYIFTSSIFDEFLNKLVAGSTINHLYQKDFVAFRFKVPPKQVEQEAIATVLSDMDKEIETLKIKLSKIKVIKEGMMQELLTGKTRLLRGENDDQA